MLTSELGMRGLPDASAFSRGGITIGVDSIVAASLGSFAGGVVVRGRVKGTLLAIDGDLMLHSGGVVEGDAISVGGRVRFQPDNAALPAPLVGGSVVELGGDLRDVSTPEPPRGRPGFSTMRREVGIALTTLALALALGAGLLIFASGHLSGAAETLALKPLKSLFVGVLAQVALLPSLVLLCTLLAITILGILLIPFAVVAGLLAAFGAGALGLLAGSQLLGTAIAGKGEHLNGRQRQMRALLSGILVIGGMWVLAAIVSVVPILGGTIRAFSFVMTWVAMTAGLGGAIIFRSSARRASSTTTEIHISDDDLSWQTPTPVAGVAAARRPVAGTTSGEA